MIERLTAVVEAQTQRFNRSMDRVNDMMRRMADTHTVEVEAEIASFQARVRQAEQQIDNFIHRHQRTRVDLDADSDDVQRAVSAARTELASLPNRVTTDINGNTSDLTRAVATAQTETRSLPNRVWIFIEARTDRFENSMNRLAKITNSVSTVIGHSLAGAFTSALPAISPVLASITGAIGSLGPMLGVAAGGVMGLGSAFAVAGTGAASFGALAVSSLSGVFKASEDLKKLQEKLDETTDAKERAKIMEKIKVIQQSLGKEEKKALDTLEDFKANWQSIAQSVQKPILKTFTSSLTTFKGVLNSLRPMFKSVANGGVTLAKSMNAAFKDTDMRRFIDYMNKNAGQAFVTFGKIAGNVLRTVMNLIVAFGPLGNDMSASLEKATASWVKWSANLGSSEKFQTFIEYVKTNGPKLLQIIGNLSGGLTKLFTGFAPMSQDMMTSLVNMTQRFNEWAGSVTKTKEFQSFIDYIKTNGPTVWSTIGEIAKTIINLLVGMAPLGQSILQTVNGFLKFTNAAMQANPAIGQFIAVGISLLGALRAIVPAIAAVSAVTNGLKDFVTAAKWVRTFVTGAEGFTLARMVSQLKTGIIWVGKFIAKYTVMAAQATANAVKMAASWTAMQIGTLVSLLKSGLVQMGLWIKNMTVMAAQSIAQASRTATAWTIMKISSFVTSLRAGIVQMGLWIKQMVVMAAQSVAQAARMAAAWTAAQISSFASMLAAGIKQMIAFGARLVVLAALAAANAARMAASWVIAMGPIAWITAAVVGLVVLIIANWDKIKAYTVKIWGILSKWLSSTWTSIKNAASKIWQLFLTLLKKNFELQKNVVLTVYNAIKSFSSKIWNSIKGAVVKVWNSLKSAASTAFLFMKNKIAGHILATREKLVNLWNSAKSKATSIWNSLKNAASTAFLYMKNKVTGHILATREKLVNLWNSAKNKVISIYNGIKSAASNAFLYMKNQIANRIIATREKIVSIWNSVMKFFKGINLKTIGRNIIQGLINGISGMAGALASKIKSMANAIPNGMKKLLGIHSPSRVMRDQVGYHVGTGMAAGIDKSQAKVKAAAARAAKAAQKAAEVKVTNKIKNAEVKYDTKKMGADTYIKTLQKIQKQNKLTSEQSRKIQREIYQAAKNASDKQKKLLKEQQRKEAKAKLAYTKKVSDQIKRAEAKYDTGKISGNTYVKTLQKISKKNKLTSDQQIKVQREIYQTQKAMADKARKQKENERKAADKINKGILSANNTYLSKFKSINDKLTSDIKAANDAYKKELQDRTNAIYNAIGLFDDVSSEKVNGSKLTSNLKNQLAKLKQFDSDIASIAGRAPKAFADELKEMGVGSADQINAIARMTSSELDEYVRLWTEKHKLASTQAAQELTGLKNETAKKINELRSAANKELSLLKSDYMRKIGELTVNVKQLGSLKNSGRAIGYNTMAGIISGMRNMKGELAKEANTIASTIEKTIKKKLKIHSPSRLMRDQVGVMVPAGIAVGIQNGIGTVQRAMATVSDAMYIEQKDMNLAYDTSISRSDLGTVRKELSADVKNLELPERTIIIEMDSKKVGQGVEKSVTDAQRRSNARRVRIN
ncbi:hypothetical protein [Bacillus subtilis]|uniref:hypothetical protein n=1 Tax=Bacillus subtilis TaxID=1423 RepID=UPI00103CC8F6|nr:hypothetical protein [Bacillus subtilis]QBJ83513.1 hypothetical protein DL538_16385 [Bacillus subtilis subsp. subtilis]